MASYVFARGDQYGKLRNWPEIDKLAEIYQEKVDAMIEKIDPTLTWYPEWSEVWGYLRGNHR